jgi:pyruvate/2-oxoglutarate dehydrogenase complex dihydrolipoamide acyltransferase (E2) component
MPIEVKMPRLSLTMESGSIVQWLKEPGARVEKGEDLAEIETDKVNVMLEAPASGYLRALLVEPGVTVACDSSIALVTATADEPLQAASTNTASSLPRSVRKDRLSTACGSFPAGHRLRSDQSCARQRLTGRQEPGQAAWR